MAYLKDDNGSPRKQSVAQKNPKLREINRQ
jgi:hypothetical protein